MKPSDFAKKEPFSSVAGKSEHETVARNIMIILARTGDKFRKLTFSEYEKERKKDGNYLSIEKLYFDAVIGYCTSKNKAKLFSKVWANL